MKDSFTGSCPACYRKFSDCECDIKTIISHNLYPRGHDTTQERRRTVEADLTPTDLEEIGDLLHTLGCHCQIARLIMEQKFDYLLPTIVEDICELAQMLSEYCIKEG